VSTQDLDAAAPAGASSSPGQPTSSSAGESRRFERLRSIWSGDVVELIAAVLLAVATVISAWSAYQATRWNGVQANATSAANATRTESVRASNQATAQQQVDIAVFIAWLQAYVGEQQGLADFYQARFRDEFKPAFETWLGSVPEGSVPEGTPFQRPEYVLAEQARADDLLAQAESLSADARAANQTGDNFILVVVIMASVLFFAGVGVKFRHPGLRKALVTLAGIMFAAGLVIVVTLPQNIGF